MPIFKAKKENFFKKWTPEMAYVLGFFAADGYMIQNKRGACFVDFYSNDLEILEKIKKVIGSDHLITKRQRSKREEQDSYKLQIGSKQWFNDLIALGFMQRKSLKLCFPAVPSKYLSDFVRGYFDGDGNVWAGMMHKNDRKIPSRVLFCSFTSGSQEFLSVLKQEMTVAMGLTGGSLLFASGAYRLSFSTRDTLKIYDFMYNMSGKLYLERKRRIFDKFIEKRQADSILRA